MNSLIIKVGNSIKMYDLIKKIHKFGYLREKVITAQGQYNVAGGNINIAPVNYKGIVLIDYFGDRIEKIKMIWNKQTRSVNKTTISPNHIHLCDKKVIKPGDYVVNIDHGIGIFRRLGLKKVTNIYKEYIFIEYLNNDYLYLPVNLIEKINPYVGIGTKKPRLNKLGTSTWKKTRKKTYESIIHLARELLEVYAKREISKRKPYKFDKSWNREVENNFPFVKTKDQEKAINEVMSDLLKDRPMERLICGDVGFGKTEVAIRTAVQVVANDCQVAMLVPTTILAEQHFVTMMSRVENLPLNVEVISRFQNYKKQKEILRNIKNGKIDLIIGTHRLLSKNIHFNNLGLLIIDEEQRFGVKDKEKLKRIKKEVDVLTLTATPIPRTLFMSLSGIRDISQINTPPRGRISIKTKVEKFDQKEVDKYINREIERGGQVYYLHNRVRTINNVKNELNRKFKKLTIDTAHGQMDEGILANVMSKFTAGEIDILVCSTIIASGLDLANVNTIIVKEADKFGLAQLYQIRGRIGRGKRQGYCLLTHKDKKITINAFKRLRTLVENCHLGSGFNIAVSDLEIRGGGNVLGKQQHGNMEMVGLVLYSKLLKKAVEELRSK